ncbi:uncharacterized protein LOC134590927 [Pelobates fuscus]|uniref:uncharacterized protein LOC134590927 n=1 Tax=Pelobates fuscus TaxID=191477 RepID=UPI002FE49AB9
MQILSFFVDGSRYADENGNFHTGYAVVSAHEVIKGEPLAPHCSAQKAELKALAEACKMASGKTANIYTDSRYAFGIVHDFGPIWRACDFLTSAGTPIKNSEAVSALMDAIVLPTQVGIIKVAAHVKITDDISRGNHKADKAAKQAAIQVHPSTDPDSDSATHKLQPGDWVVIKRHVWKGLEPCFDGPFQVLLTTATSVKLEGKATWIHASHCKQVTPTDPPT